MKRTIDILNGIPHAIALLDTRLRLVAMNASLESLSGYAASEAKGTAAEFVLRPSFGTRDWQTAVEKGEKISCEGDVINAVRQKVPVRFTATPLRDEKDRVSGLLVVLEDISLLRELDQKAQTRNPVRSIIGHSAGMQEVFELLPVLAATDATVLITGETGTGKDLLAETIHQESKRAGHPFIKVNCGAIPEALLESELFGHKRGAFTGAHSDKPGMFLLAEGGTIFLTEIGDLPLQLQVKLLTVLDDREFYPLGSSRKMNVDVRIITGTHRDLRQLVREGRFREDLYFRLNVLRAHLPPIRERGEDVRLLLDHFLHNISANLKKDIKGFSPSAMSCLQDYPFPGNVRELRNVVEFAANMSKNGWIEDKHLPPYVLSREEQPLRQSIEAARNSQSPAGQEGPIFRSATISSWTELEKKKILAALTNSNGNRTKAARELGWGRSTLWRKINQHGIG